MKERKTDGREQRTFFRTTPLENQVRGKQQLYTPRPGTLRETVPDSKRSVSKQRSRHSEGAALVVQVRVVFSKSGKGARIYTK
jgi:hypothetical protein